MIVVPETEERTIRLELSRGEADELDFQLSEEIWRLDREIAERQEAARISEDIVHDVKRAGMYRTYTDTLLKSKYILQAIDERLSAAMPWIDEDYGEEEE